MDTNTEKLRSLLIHTRKTLVTDGFRLTVKRKTKQGTIYIEVFVWNLDMPNEDEFVTATIIEGDFDMISVIKAVESVPVSSIIASFNLAEGRSNGITSLQPLTELIKGAPGICLHEFWTKAIPWRLLSGNIPVQAPQAWLSLISISLDLTTESLEDQSEYQVIITTGLLRKFLDQLQMLQHLSLVFYTEIPKQDILWPHAPLEYNNRFYLTSYSVLLRVHEDRCLM
jgi:hypothetical protein